MYVKVHFQYSLLFFFLFFFLKVVLYSKMHSSEFTCWGSYTTGALWCRNCSSYLLLKIIQYRAVTRGGHCWCPQRHLLCSPCCRRNKPPSLACEQTILPACQNQPCITASQLINCKLQLLSFQCIAKTNENRLKVKRGEKKACLVEMPWMVLFSVCMTAEPAGSLQAAGAGAPSIHHCC